jgi:hypothetical protein
MRSRVERGRIDPGSRVKVLSSNKSTWMIDTLKMMTDRPQGRKVETEKDEGGKCSKHIDEDQDQRKHQHW